MAQMSTYDLNEESIIHNGTFSTGIKGLHREKQVQIYAKIGRKENDLSNERYILKKIDDHSNIIQFLDVFCRDDGSWCLVLEYCNLRDLQAYCKTQRPSTEFTMNVMGQISSALDHIHSLLTPIVHRDVQPEHILLSKEGSITCAKLGGFRLAIQSENARSILQDDGAIDKGLYSAPELWSTNGYTAAIDVFSLGLVLESMLHYGNGVIKKLQPAIAILPKADRTTKIGELMFNKQGNYNLSDRIDDDNDDLVKCKELLQQMTEFDPNKRPSMAKVLKILGESGESSDTSIVVGSSWKISESNKDKYKSLNINIHMPDSPCSNLGSLDARTIGQLEKEFGVNICCMASDTKEKNQDVFRELTSELEVKDTENKFTMIYAKGDITTFRCDAIVNSAYCSLNFDDGVLSKAIGKAGGAKMKKECRDYIKKHGSLKRGDFYISGPGNLHCKYVFHLASPRWECDGGEHHGVNECMYSAVSKILEKADILQLRRIALPAISAGGFGFPIEVSLMSIFSAVKDYFTHGKKFILREVCLVDTSADMIKTTMEKCFGEVHVKTKEKKIQENQNTINITVTCERKAEEVLEKIIMRLKAHTQGVVGEIQEVCPTWSPMHASEMYRLDEVSLNSTDYIQIKEMFDKYVENVEIVEVKRVQNRELYREILDHKNMLKVEIGNWTPDMEMKVWHATSEDSAKQILRDGFDKKYVGEKFAVDYGRGLYFGHTAYVSDLYAADYDLKHVFMCSVLVGNKYETSGKKTKNFELPDGKHSVYWERYKDIDSALKDVHEVVVYRNTQVYPDYMITYVAREGYATKARVNSSICEIL